jgi:hypothetical protein
MLTVVVALAVLLAVGLTLGRAPLFRALVSLLTLAVFILITAPWLSRGSSVSIAWRWSGSLARSSSFGFG